MNASQDKEATRMSQQNFFEAYGGSASHHPPQAKRGCLK